MDLYKVISTGQITVDGEVFRDATVMWAADPVERQFYFDPGEMVQYWDALTESKQQAMCLTAWSYLTHEEATWTAKYTRSDYGHVVKLVPVCLPLSSFRYEMDQSGPFIEGVVATTEQGNTELVGVVNPELESDAETSDVADQRRIVMKQEKDAGPLARTKNGVLVWVDKRAVQLRRISQLMTILSAHPNRSRMALQRALTEYSLCFDTAMDAPSALEA